MNLLSSLNLLPKSIFYFLNSFVYPFDNHINIYFKNDESI